ncbi:MAG: hypothetical protein NVS4B7_18330 [Ktedonobacteraceae bacterium]
MFKRMLLLISAVTGKEQMENLLNLSKVPFVTDYLNSYAIIGHSLIA